MDEVRAARSNADDAYQTIRKLIVTAAMPPGSAFTEGDMVKRLDFGKTPVREALLRLKLEKLITVQPRTGYRVAPVTFKDVRDACHILRNMEADTIVEAAGDPGARALLDPFQTQVEAGAAADRGGESTDGWIRADWRFHLALARNQDNQLQAEILTRLHLLVLRFRYLAIALGVPGRKLTHDHGDLLDALEKGDADGAVATTRRTWDEVEMGLVTLLSATEPMQRTNVWSGNDDQNALYLDTSAPGPTAHDVFD